MPKKKIKRIRLDAPSEQAVQLKERLATLEADVKRVDDDMRDIREIQRSG